MVLDIMAIPLSQGLFALVDGEDYEELSKHKWCANKIGKTFYAVRAAGKYPNQRIIYMHRQILNAQTGDETDHHGSYGLDNRKQNIRLCTHAQNLHNQRPQKNKTSKFKGVSWHKKAKKWKAQIKKGGRYMYLGCFDNEIEAAKTYDRKAKELFGKFALLNFGREQCA